MADIGRTVSKRLRELGASAEIRCTSSLVQAYNNAIEEDERFALSSWIEHYLKEVANSQPESFSAEHLHEFAGLGEISQTDGCAAELVNRVFCYLRKHVKTGDSCSLNVIIALEHFLAVVDPKILEPEADNLSSLVNDLLDKTDPQKRSLDRSTYVSQTAYLLTLEKTLIALHGIKGDKFGTNTVKFFKQTIEQRLNSIIAEQNYFPIACHAQIVKQNIKMLFLESRCSFLAEIGRSVFLFLSGGLHVCQGLREIAELKYDLDVILSGIKEMGKAISRWRFPGIPDLYEISLSFSETVAFDDFRIFMNCCDKLGSWKRGRKMFQKSVMIKYAILMHLCLFFGEESSQAIQEEALSLLNTLALDEGHSHWRSNAVLYEGLLDVITSIAVQCSYHEATFLDIFNQMSSRADEVQRKAIEDFLSGKSVEEKVHIQQKPKTKDTRRSLFHIVRTRARIHQTHSIRIRNRQLLTENYNDDTFAKALSVIGSSQEKHVKNFDFSLVVYEKVLVRNDSGGLYHQDAYSQVVNNIQRTMRVKKSINIQEIFDKRKKYEQGPLEEIRTVLAIGNPGTGKTSLSKRLCYEWANKNWGTKFTHVYLLRVRQLGRGERGSQKDLVEAIVNRCYNADRRFGNVEALYDEVKDRLQETTTLLILDGLDEGGPGAWELVRMSMQQPCSLMLLSRPHNVQRVRERADIEIECLGFNSDHMERFVGREVQPENNAKNLLQFLKKSTSIWEAALVPVNATIICNIWMSSAKEELETMTMMDVARLYGQMTKYAWERYIEKWDAKAGEKVSVLSSLEVIAFKSFEQGNVEIPENLVTELSQTNSIAILRDVGFLLFQQEGQVFQFAHLTFHEYFAARQLMNMLRSNDEDEKTNAKKFIAKHKYSETSRVMLAFMTRLYCGGDDVKQSLKKFKTLLDILDENPVEPIGMQHTFLKMRTLDVFLTCCPDEDEQRSTNDHIRKIISAAEEVLKNWLDSTWSLVDCGVIKTIHERLWNQTIDDLVNMPNLLREYPYLLEIILTSEDVFPYAYVNIFEEILRLGKLNPQAVGKMVPSIVGDLERWGAWIKLCSNVSEECAAVALSHLIEADKTVDQGERYSIVAAALDLMDAFPDNKELRQIVCEASQHSDAEVRRRTMNAIGSHSFLPGSSAEEFAWELQKLGTQDSDVDVKREAFHWLGMRNPSSTEAINETIELITQAIDDLDECGSGTDIVYTALRNAPHKENELLFLLTKICLHVKRNVRAIAVNLVWDIHRDSLLQKDKLLSFVSSVCQDSASDVQQGFLPLLSILEAESTTLLTNLDEPIANEWDVDNEEVKQRAIACKEARVILSNTAICDIKDKFDHIEEWTQLEILRQIHNRKLLTLEDADAAAEMALFYMVNGNNEGRFDFDHVYENVAINLLIDISKESLLPAAVLKELAIRGRDRVARGWGKGGSLACMECDRKSALCIRVQPMSHLLNYYFQTKDDQIVPAIAEKLLLTPVFFSRISQSTTKAIIFDGGNMDEQKVSTDEVLHLISLCKDYLKTSLYYKHIS